MPNVAGDLNSLPFPSLIGGPLDAAIQAQSQAAMSSVQFIRDVGFDDQQNVRAVTFKVKRGDDTTTVEVPLLTIVPIPFIRIDEMSIDFKANVTSTNEKEDTSATSKQFTGSVKGSARWLFFKASLQASYSSKKDSSSTEKSRYAVETTIDVHVHAVQDEMPAGMSKILNILSDSITAPPPVGGGTETGKK